MIEKRARSGLRRALNLRGDSSRMGKQPGTNSSGRRLIERQRMGREGRGGGGEIKRIPKVSGKQAKPLYEASGLRSLPRSARKLRREGQGGQTVNRSGRSNLHLFSSADSRKNVEKREEQSVSSLKKRALRKEKDGPDLICVLL